MKQVIILIVFTLFISCKNDNKHKVANTDSFNSELYDKILEFQNKVKFVKNSNDEIADGVKSIESALIHIYEIKFYIEDKDTIAGLTLYSGGINSYYSEEIRKNEKIYGIYEDDTLKPTYINDPYQIGRSFVKEYMENPNTISKFYQKNDFINDDIYDVCRYKVKGKKLIFFDVLTGNKR